MGLVEKQSIQDIADAIRNRNGLTTLYKPREMDEAILNLYSTTKVNNMLDYILPCYENSDTSFEIKYADSDRPCSISELEGNTTQNGTPTPTNTIPIYTETDDKEIVVCGKNKIDISKWVKGRINNSTGNIEYAGNVSSMVISDNAITFTVTQAWNSGIASDFMPVTQGTYTYTYSHNREISMFIDAYNSNKTKISRLVSYTQSTTPTTRTFTISDSNVKYIRIHFEVNTANVEYIVSNMQLEPGTISTDYEEHKGNSYRVDFGGKNKFNYANTTITNSGITTTYNNGEISYSGTATTTYANLTDVTSLSLPAGTYTFSREGTNNVKLTLRVWNASNVRTDYNINANSNSTTFTISEKTDRTYLFLAGLTANTQYSGSIKVQLEKRKCSNTIQSLCRKPFIFSRNKWI